LYIFRKLKKQQEKLCNTAIGRELPECYSPVATTATSTALSPTQSSSSINPSKFKKGSLVT